MKHIILIYIFIFSSSSFSQTIKKNLLIGIPDYCPFSCINNSRKGFMLDIVDHIFKSKKISYKFQLMPWSRGVTETMKGRLDILLAPSKMEGPGFIYPKEEIAIQGECFFKRKKDSWRPINAKSFVGRKTAVFKDWSFEDKFIKKLNLDLYHKSFLELVDDEHYNPRSIKMIANKRLDAYLQDPLNFSYFKSQNKKLKEIEMIKKAGCLKKSKLYLGLNPQNPKLSKKIAKIFDRGMIKLRKSKKLSKILKKYNLKDWRK